MINFFLKHTRFLWITSRILLILLFLTTLVSRFNDRELSNLIVNFLLAFYIGSMILIAIFGLLKRHIHFAVRLFVGIFTVFSGLAISYLLLIVNNGEYSVFSEIGFQIIPFWILLYGVYELLKAIETFRSKKLKLEPK